MIRVGEMIEIFEAKDLTELAAVRERLVKIGLVVQGSTPDYFAKMMASEHKKWSDVREKAGIEQK